MLQQAVDTGVITRTISLKADRRRPRVLTASQAQTILDGCEHLRDRLLFALLLDTGVRIGEALGLRHAQRQPARVKAGRSRTIPASAELMRLYSDYLHCEYGALDSDYVFVNLFAEPHGRPWGYPAVYDLVKRLRKSTGITFDRMVTSPSKMPGGRWRQRAVHRPGGPAVTAVEKVPARPGLLKQLMAVVRPEFRTEIY
ncbi:tyrosine-type recombinase/integrase [Streptomyces sp. FxanaA7]|uniref:tyrosine-type recombinase/integrase n=1 Tax=Streptomyces sp. FxanaA7 TaxID=1265492 RepID=UPI0006987CFE|nr:tyrosine-type recombinase/integrase [Streptomyces sp. FxanaA7]